MWWLAGLATVRILACIDFGSPRAYRMTRQAPEIGVDLVKASEASKGSVLVTCGGKWVGLVGALKAAAGEVWGVESRVAVADREQITPAGYFADESWQVPAIGEDSYVDSLLTLCRQHRYTALVPLVDTDLARLVPFAPDFERIGTRLVAPKAEIAEVCLDKVEFAALCGSSEIPHPKVALPADFSEPQYPLIAKPRRGFGSIGLRHVANSKEAEALHRKDPAIMFQERFVAEEFSVDGYINRNGECIVLVPRLRCKVVGGEAQRSVTTEPDDVWQIARRMCDVLARHGYQGPVNIQVFGGDAPAVLEVNPRLGSASVLSNAATGGRFFRALLGEAHGEVATGSPEDYAVGLRLYRFTGDVFYRDSVVAAAVPPKIESARD